MKTKYFNFTIEIHIECPNCGANHRYKWDNYYPNNDSPNSITEQNYCCPNCKIDLKLDFEK